MNEKNTPRDFFLHAGMFATLYMAAIALITLLFGVINYAHPDEVMGLYRDPYSSSMRFAIASLIILVPVFLYLARRVQREARQDTTRRQLGIRKWLTYITLFIAGVTIVGDLIALLNSFLGGTLATPFLLKVLVLFVVVGIGFLYFLLDIRGYWMTHESQSKGVGAGVALLVLVSIVGGFWIIGTPSVQRDIRLDNQQIQDLQMVQNQVVQYWQNNEALPESLAAIESNVTRFRVPGSPDGRMPYTYSATDELTFELCATFTRDSKQQSRAFEMYGIRGDADWSHEAGMHCFERTIDPELVPTRTAPALR